MLGAVPDDKNHVKAMSSDIAWHRTHYQAKLGGVNLQPINLFLPTGNTSTFKDVRETCKLRYGPMIQALFGWQVYGSSSLPFYWFSSWKGGRVCHGTLPNWAGPHMGSL